MLTRSKVSPETICEMLPTLAQHAHSSFFDLFEMLGYPTDRLEDLGDGDPTQFLHDFGLDDRIHRDRSLTTEWRSVDGIFQLDAEEIDPTERKFQVLDRDNKQSYYFLGVSLSGQEYSRGKLAGIVRELNRVSDVPIFVLFRYGKSEKTLLTFAIVDRRPSQQQGREDRDVISSKVTMLKDIDLANPHRAHLEILADLALPQVLQDKREAVTNFETLHRAWERVLDTSELNKRFFGELSNWYFWAIERPDVNFPAGAEADRSVRNATSVIRLVSRLMFVWFLREKKLVEAGLFTEQGASSLLRADLHDREDSSYYKAVLQNLFFATLNTERSQENAKNRQFRSKSKQASGRDGNYMAHSVFRYEDCFKDSAKWLGIVKDIPFLNGGLFECLDRYEVRDGQERVVRIDGFSDRQDNPLSVPNDLFFGEEQTVDLSQAYGQKSAQFKKAKVRGLLKIFDRYKFTVDENTPLEEDVALDPELLGKVFENLLASYNPETGTTARKQTGSFYTPREIVSYMVDEALIAYFVERLLSGSVVELGSGQGRLFALGAGQLDLTERSAVYGGSREELERDLRSLFSYTAENPFNDRETDALIAAIDSIKVLDPACGSGAFPMGVLQRLVFLLGKLDPGNGKWKDRQLEQARLISDDTAREAAIGAIEAAFKQDNFDYGRKLFLIQNCIFGVDIQPVAVQIAKLRCFIALIVEQRADEDRENRGILPLPNLETKFVAANSLISLDRPGLRSPEVIAKEAELAAVRRKHFTAKSPATKRKFRDLDQVLRSEIGGLLKAVGLPGSVADSLASWSPYDQNGTADFFEPGWMFGCDRFDLVIGNPPYVRQENIKPFKDIFKAKFECYTGTCDLFVYFFEQGIKLLNEGGFLSYICSNKYFRAGYGQKLREFLGRRSRLRQIIDFGDAPVFKAIAYPSIILAQRGEPSRDERVRVLTWEPGRDLSEFGAVWESESFSMLQSELTPDGWRLESGEVLGLLAKLRSAGLPLGEYVKGRFYRGILTGFNEAFVVDRVTRDRLVAEDARSAEVLKPYLRGRDVKRWVVNDPDLWLIFTRRGTDIEQYPAIKKHLLQFKERLTPGTGRKAGSYKWFEIQDNVAYWEEFDTPKILYQEIATYQAFSWDESRFFSNNKTFLIPDANKFILALLNSSSVWFFLDHTVGKMAGGTYAMQTPYISQIPIPDPKKDPDRVAQIETLVQQILDQKQTNPAADVSAIEREIDQHVYQLYDLTIDEIAIVENTTR